MLTLKRITRVDSPWFAEVDALYERAFPLHEKREPQAKTRALNNENYALQAWFDDREFIGMIGSWRFSGYTYIEHLAVNDRVRAQGYGKRMLNQFLQMHPQTILEIDPLTTKTAHNRLRFYQGLGFHQNSFEHIHPTYHTGTPDHALIVLSYPRQISDAQYERFKHDLCIVVMERETH